jgi:hypothetical protein
MLLKAHVRYAVTSGLAAAVLQLCCSPVSAQTPVVSAAVLSGPGSLAGVWTLSGYKGSGGRNSERDRVQHTVDGKWPPMLPWAAELVEKRISMSQQGDPFANTLTQCLPGGVPLMVFGAPYPVQILETPGQITMLFEEQNHFRLIILNGGHPRDPDPSFMGHSIGHWEGAALLVDTIGLTDRTTIDQIGTPHSDELHVIERYRRVDRNTLEITVTIDDPKAFTNSWDARAIYKAAPPGTQVGEYICENNRNGPGEQGQTTFGPAQRR